MPAGGSYQQRTEIQFRIPTNALFAEWSILKMEEAVKKQYGYPFLEGELTREPNFVLSFIYESAGRYVTIFIREYVNAIFLTQRLINNHTIFAALHTDHSVYN